ncbi:MAG: hypothetical protein NVS2B14_16820 [Chamaesiphon sp.]
MRLTYWIKCLPLFLLTSFIPAHQVGANSLTPRTVLNPRHGINYIERGYGQLQARIWFRLPSRGAPNGTVIGGTRGGQCSPKSPIGLLPKTTNLGITTANQPTIFLYVPQNSATSAEFVLKDDLGKQVYKTKLFIPTTSGIFSLTLPAEVTSSSLEFDKNYQWSFSMICDADDASANASVQGWIVRGKPNATLSEQLNSAKPYERPAIYAKAGFWYDTLSTLAELRRSNPNDVKLADEWSELLKSVGLNSVAGEPLLSDSQKPGTPGARIRI